MAARLNGPEAEGVELKINFVFTDLKESYVLTLKNSVLHHYQGTADPDADVTLNISHNLFLDIALGQVGVKELLFSDQLSVDGSKIDLLRFFALQDAPNGNFSIVTP